jgi:hypothetical protein
LRCASPLPLTGNEKITPQDASSVALDDDGVGNCLVADDRSPEPHNCGRPLLACRILTDGVGEDVGRDPVGVGARSIAASSELDCHAGALARARHVECPPPAAKAAYRLITEQG